MPSFVIGTGDYMFSFGLEAQSMANIYMSARQKYPGPFYPVMGNHECDTFDDSNCASSPPTNMKVFESTMLAPIQQTLPYYSQTVTAGDGSWQALEATLSESSRVPEKELVQALTAQCAQTLS